MTVTTRPHSVTPYAREICNIATRTPERVGEQLSKYPPVVHQHLAVLHRIGVGPKGEPATLRAKLNADAIRIPAMEAITELTEADPAKLARGLTEGLRRIEGK